MIQDDSQGKGKSNDLPEIRSEFEEAGRGRLRSPVYPEVSLLKMNMVAMSSPR